MITLGTLALWACNGTHPNQEDDTGVAVDDSTPWNDDSGDDSSTFVPELVTLYVDAANAADTEPDGTAEHPFADLSSAFLLVEELVAQSPQPEVRVEVATGTYVETALLNASGTENAPITIHGADLARPMVTGQDKAATALYLNGDYIVLENVEVSDTKTAGIAISGNHVTVRWCVVHDIGCCGHGVGIAFVLADTTGTLIESTTFYNTGLRGIEADDVDGAVFRNNIFFDNGSPIIDTAAFIELLDAKNVIAENNYFRDDDLKVAYGILVQGGSDLVLRRNLFVDLLASGIRVEGSDRTTLVHNTLVSFEDRGRTTALVAVSGSPSELVMTGNVLSQTDGLLVSFDSNPTGADHWVDGNAYWKLLGGDWFELEGARLPNDLPAWTKASTFDEASISADPMLGAWGRANPPEFAPDAKSPVLDTYAGPTVTTAPSAGTEIEVAHASPFAIHELAPVQSIVVGGQAAEVESIEDETITVSTALSVEIGMPVSFPSEGKGPDYGAVEAGGTTEIGNAAASASAFN